MSQHDGHRQRVRERFRSEGLEHFQPHEVLELLLFYTRARGDTNAAAHALLDRFGSLHAVLEAAPDQLMTVPGIGEESAVLLSLMVPLFRRYQQSSASEKRVIRTAKEAESLVRSLFTGLRQERLYAITLSVDGTVLGTRLIAEGTPTEVAAAPRLVVEDALNRNAHSVILCHNHPGGQALPSAEDRRTTAALNALLLGLNITLLDHWIVAGDAVYSMAAAGDREAWALPNRTKGKLR